MDATPTPSVHSRRPLTGDDRRAYRRLPLDLHVEIRSTVLAGRVVERAITEDISPGGLRFSTFNWRQMPVGARFEVTVSLPFESVIFADCRRLVTMATVVHWVEEDRTAGRNVPLRRRVGLRFDRPLAFAASA